MAAIAAEQVKALRDKTGAGFGECKAALAEANGNIDEAVTILRKRGLALAAKRVGRSTGQGQIGAYIHAGGKIGVLIEVNCESDFVANTDDFRNLMKELAMQVAAADPKYVSREQVPAEELEREKAIYRAQVEGKPANVIDKIVDGKLNSYFERFCRVDQPSIRDGAVKVSDLIAQVIAKLGENITVSRVTRYKLGEGA